MPPPSLFLIVGRAIATQELVTALKTEDMDVELFSRENDLEGLIKKSSQCRCIIIRAPMFTEPPLVEVIERLRLIRYRGKIIADYVPRSLSAAILKKAGADEVFFGREEIASVVAHARENIPIAPQPSAHELYQKSKRSYKKRRASSWR